MKSLLFCLFIAAALSQQTTGAVYRFINGSIAGDDSIVNVSGSFYYLNVQGYNLALLAGMDTAGFTPLIAVAASKNTDPEGDLDHVDFQWGFEESGKAKGLIILSKNGKSLMIGGQFTDKDKKNYTFAANSTSVETFFYPGKEAGKRATKLVNQDAKKFDAVNVVYYAISDVAFLNNSCTMFFRKGFADLTKEEPGAIIVAKDGKHCGIVDDKGTSFVHSDQAKGKILIEKIANINNVFKNGFTYKRSPKKGDPGLLY